MKKLLTKFLIWLCGVSKEAADKADGKVDQIISINTKIVFYNPENDDYVIKAVELPRIYKKLKSKK